MGTNLCHLESTEATVSDHRLFTAAAHGSTAGEGVACANADCNSEESSSVSPGIPSV